MFATEPLITAEVPRCWLVSPQWCPRQRSLLIVARISKPATYATCTHSMRTNQVDQRGNSASSFTSSHMRNGELLLQARYKHENISANFRIVLQHGIYAEQAGTCMIYNSLLMQLSKAKCGQRTRDGTAGQHRDSTEGLIYSRINVSCQELPRRQSSRHLDSDASMLNPGPRDWHRLHARFWLGSSVECPVRTKRAAADTTPVLMCQ